MKENLHTPDSIRTHSGIYMNVFEPTMDMIQIEDIAHALSHLPRFGGHLPEFYAVSQHSVMCSRGVNPEYRLQALLHDASEAYLLDIPTPIKKRLSEYKELEDRLMSLIAEKFGFNYPLDDQVKQIDAHMLEFEWEYLMLQKPKAFDFICWSPTSAKRIFLEEFERIKQL